MTIIKPTETVSQDVPNTAKTRSISRIGKELYPAPKNFKYFLSFEELNLMGKLDELFLLYIDFFSNDLGEKYYCTAPGCGMIYPVHDDPSTAKLYPIKCKCGGLLNEYYVLEQLKLEYSGKGDTHYNIMLDDDGRIVGFTCGEVLRLPITDALLGAHYKIYKNRFPEIHQVSLLISDFFMSRGGDSENILYFADSGGIMPKYRNNLAPLIDITRPLYQAAFELTNKQLVCINYFQSSMYKLNTMLGFTEIAKYDELVYMGLSDVTSVVELYQNVSCAEVTRNYRNFLKRRKVLAI